MHTQYQDLLIQLKFLLNSGVPVKSALDSIARKKGPRSLAAVLLSHVENGQCLGEAMGSYPRRIPAEHAALVLAGERSGRLTEVIDNIIEDAASIAEIRKSFLIQVLYPAVVIVAALVLGPLSLYVFTGRVVAHFPAYFVVILFMTAVVLFLWKGPKWLPPDSGLRLSLERFLLAIPGLRGLLHSSLAGRALRLEGMLLGAGLSFEESLPLVGETMGWELLRADLARVEDSIQGGSTAAEGFRHFSGLSDDVLSRLAAAETSGNLDAAMKLTGEELLRSFQYRLTVTLKILPYLLYLIAFLAILQYAFSVLPSTYF
jgi:type II secretory pathway component PulF